MNNTATSDAPPDAAPDAAPDNTFRGSTSFFGRSSLPEDPEARRLEKRGRRWLIVSYTLCPCHLPVTMTLLGFLLGGSAVGTVVGGNSLAVGVVLGVLYAVVLWRGFRSLRRAKRLAGPGGRIDCSGETCEVVPASLPVPSAT